MHRRVLLACCLFGPLLAACQTPPAQGDVVREVFFTEDNAALDKRGRTVVAEAAALARANPNAPVRVLVFAGPALSRGYNQPLTDARARHVADTMVAQGVAAGRIQVGPRGAVPFEVIPTERRRVEIRIGG